MSISCRARSISAAPRRHAQGSLPARKTGHEIRAFKHENSVSSVAFSPDGARVLTGSRDGTARIWDALPTPPEAADIALSLNNSAWLVSRQGDVLMSPKDLRDWQVVPTEGMPLNAIAPVGDGRAFRSGTLLAALIGFPAIASAECASGYTEIPVPLCQLSSPTLSNLTVSPSTVAAGTSAGTVIGAISGTTSGSSLSLSGLSVASSISISGANIIVGPSLPSSATTITFSIVETLSGATNTPHTTSGLSVTVTSSGTTTVDDTDSSIVYSSPNTSFAWGTASSGSAYGGSYHYNNSCSSPPQSGISIQGAMAAINFTGASITLLGETGPNFGIGAWAIDGGSLTTVDAYSASNADQQTLVSVSGLSSGPHVLTYQVTCNKNSSSSDYYQVIDAYQVTGSSNPISNGTAGTATGGVVTYGYGSGGRWNSGSSNTNLSGGQSYDNGAAGDSISWSFTGSLIEIFGRPE
jgi:WD domain, G-beta repeat